jgi:hypothetical protein
MNKTSFKADLFEGTDVTGVGRLIMVVIGRETSRTHLVEAGRFGDGPVRAKFLDISG